MSLHLWSRGLLAFVQPCPVGVTPLIQSYKIRRLMASESATVSTDTASSLGYREIDWNAVRGRCSGIFRQTARRTLIISHRYKMRSLQHTARSGSFNGLGNRGTVSNK